MFSADHPQQPSFQSREEAAASLRQIVENHRRDLENYRQDDKAWAHWDYSPEEWAQFDTIDWRPRLRLALCLLSGLVTGFTFGSALLFLGAYIPGLLLIGGITALVTPFAFWLSGMMGGDKRRHQVRQKLESNERRVTFGKQGMWIAGAFVTFDNGLKKVKMTLQPPVLRFRAFVALDSYEGDAVIRVLVPRGREDEAASLAQRYQALLAAEKQRLERFKNPPEPR